jgi:hydroxyacylglutathione hydrolase
MRPPVGAVVVDPRRDVGIYLHEAAERGLRIERVIEPLRDGQRLSLGEVTLEIVATPGHTPESICVIIWEHPDDHAPRGVLRHGFREGLWHAGLHEQGLDFGLSV